MVRLLHNITIILKTLFVKSIPMLLTSPPSCHGLRRTFGITRKCLHPLYGILLRSIKLMSMPTFS